MTDDFRKLVADLREAQRTYFRTRAQVDLNEARVLERRVDQYLERHPTQTGLFDARVERAVSARIVVVVEEPGVIASVTSVDLEIGQSAKIADIDGGKHTKVTVRRDS